MFDLSLLYHGKLGVASHMGMCYDTYVTGVLQFTPADDRVRIHRREMI